jgi:hypothetical protein
MKFDTYKSGTSVLPNPGAVIYPSCLLKWASQPQYEASTWVHLRELPSPFSFNEAMLLCKQSDDEWIVWIPEHGEAVLHTSQFCSIDLDNA